MTLAKAVSSAVKRHGAGMTIRRETAIAGANSWTQGTISVAFYACAGRERGYKPSEIRGAILERDALIVVDPATLPAGIVPKPGDRIALGTYVAENPAAEWRQIVNVYAPRVGAAVGTYRLQVRA